MKRIHVTISYWQRANLFPISQSKFYMQIHTDTHTAAHIIGIWIDVIFRWFSIWMNFQTTKFCFDTKAFNLMRQHGFFLAIIVDISFSIWDEISHTSYLVAVNVFTKTINNVIDSKLKLNFLFESIFGCLKILWKIWIPENRHTIAFSLFQIPNISACWFGRWRSFALLRFNFNQLFN